MREKVKDYAQCIGFLSFFLLIIIGFPVLAFINGYDRTIHVDKDAYVSDYTPDVNYGSEDFLRIGRDNYGKVRTYYHFNISSQSSGWREAWIYVKFDFGTNFIDVGVYLTRNNWDETAITWNNQPQPTEYKGHILCDGFEFRIPIDLDEIIDGGVSVCLCEMQEVDEGYLQAYSKESNSYYNQIAEIELSYTGFDPIVFWTIIRVLILIFGIIGLIIFAAILAARLSKPRRAKREQKQKELIQNLTQNNLLQDNANHIANNIGPPAHMNRYYSRTVPTLEKQINQYITLKLEHGRTFIYVNGRRFIQCIRLVLNIRKQDIPMYDEIESIDEAANVYKNHIYQNRIVQGPMAAPVRGQSHDITPEQEFWGHCSNLQAWVENEYDTRILMSNISFPLLRELSRAGDPVAKRVYKEEIAVRLESGYPSVVQYLLAQGYLGEFSPDEFETILESTGLIQKLSSYSKVLSSFLNTCIRKFPTLIDKIMLEILNLPNWEELLLSMINIDIPYSKLPEFLQNRIIVNRIRFLVELENVFDNLLKNMDESKCEGILDCLNAIKKQLSVDINSISSSPLFKNPDFQKILLEQLGLDDIKGKILKKMMPSRCNFCGKIIPKDKDFCEWCGHKKRDDGDDKRFFPYPFIFKPPGGGGSMKAVAVVKNELAA